MCFFTLSSKGRASSDMVRSNKSGLTDMVFLLVLSGFVFIQAYTASIIFSLCLLRLADSEKFSVLLEFDSLLQIILTGTLWEW